MKTFQTVTSCLLLVVLVTGCKRDQKIPMLSPTAADPTEDVHSFARPDEAVIRHLDLSLAADFSTRILSGTATYTIEVREGAGQIILDVRNLDIQRVTVDDLDTDFELGTSVEWLGQPLVIPVTPASKKLAITYSTRPEADAVQWLEPSQTAGKKHPYLFTQGQAILTRTWIPIQDSPGIRLTYSATIQVPSDLMAVMSASNPQKKNETGSYSFTMAQPIPAYLIALAIGDLEFVPVSTRTGVYAEPTVVQSAAKEFEDMEPMLKAAEEMYGPYQWERYDVIVLPPSFPFGGMENPRLTFATPTIIAGDKSLVSLIAHELAHSWSGNLVTNATWNDFWLNEGFTVYFELRIMEALYGKSYRDMLNQLGYQSMSATARELDPRDTHLFLDLKGRNPDDGMTDIAYEKGAHLLILLEQLTGREIFDTFLRNYFTSHAFQSMTTSRFLNYLDTHLIRPNQLDVNIDEWVYGPGLPANCPVTPSARFDAVDVQLAAFQNGTAAASLDTREWSTHEWLHFLRALPDTLSDDQMKGLDGAFDFTNSGNSEIQAAWYTLALDQGYGRVILPSIREFLVEVGRRKFLTPIYKAMLEAGMKKEAEVIFKEARPNYHTISFTSIEALLAASN